MDETVSPMTFKDGGTRVYEEGQELRAQHSLIDIAIECSERLPTLHHAPDLSELWVFDTGCLGPGRCFPLVNVVSGRWEVLNRVDLPFGLGDFQCVLKSVEEDVGFFTLTLRPLVEGDCITLINPTPLNAVEGKCGAWVTHIQRSDVNTGEPDSDIFVSWKVLRVGVPVRDHFDDLSQLLAQPLPALQDQVNRDMARIRLGNNRPVSLPEPAKVRRMRAAAYLMDRDERLGKVLFLLFCVHFLRFRVTENSRDAAHSVSYARQLVAHFQGSEKVGHFQDLLAAVHWERWRRSKDPREMDAGILFSRRAVESTPASNDALFTRLGTLSVRLRERFLNTHNIADAVEIISTLERAYEMCPQDGATQLTLASMYLEKHEVTKSPSDLNKAIRWGDLARSTAKDRKDLVGNFVLLILMFGHRCSTNSTHFAETIATARGVLGLLQRDDESLPSEITLLASLIATRFRHDLTSVNNAVQATAQGMGPCPSGHNPLPQLVSVFAPVLGKALGLHADLSNNATSLRSDKEAMGPTSNDEPLHFEACQSSGLALLSRFALTKDSKHLGEAVRYIRKAADLSASDRMEDVSTLALSLIAYPVARDPSILTEGISMIRQSIDMNPGRQDKGRMGFLLLGGAAMLRYLTNGRPSDMSEAIAVLKRALEANPGADDSPYISSAIGWCLAFRDGPGDWQAAVPLCKAGVICTPGDVKMQLICAQSWALLASKRRPGSPDAMDAFDASLNLLTLNDPLAQVGRGCFADLRGVSDFPSAAAAAACGVQQFEKAIEWLERGRCLVWGHLDQHRPSFDRLYERDERLECALEDVAEERRYFPPDQLSKVSSACEERAPLEERTQPTKWWDDLLGEVRRLKPLKWPELQQRLPHDGTVVVLNVYSSRCDAIALLCGLGEPYHIPLPRFSWLKAKQYMDELRNELTGRCIRERWRGQAPNIDDLGRKLGAFGTNDSRKRGAVLLRILRCLWVEVVKPILDMLGIPKRDPSSQASLPRVWWCPTGPLSALPIHAAGVYGAADSECLLDYAVSSYTPTVMMLTQEATKYSAGEKGKAGLFLTSQPAVPGAGKIPGTTKEARSIFEKARTQMVRVAKAEGDDVSPDGCLEYMKTFSSIHLACHGVQAQKDPLKSHFKFHHGNLDLSKIMGADLRNADFAFLSACQTGAGHQEFSDEAFHLAAGMLAAGYRRVVATMWSIRDDIAPQVAEDFYDFLWSRGDRACRGGGFDGAMSAFALHHAIQKLRCGLGNSEEDLLAWIPYVHFGY